MLVIDTSALMAVLLNAAEASECTGFLASQEHLLISAGTLTECMIVAERRGVGVEMAGLIDGLEVEIAPVTGGSARRAAGAYSRWGKAIHPAGLNFGDCFAYELAKSENCPLLFVGNDFSKTDIICRRQLGVREGNKN